MGLRALVFIQDADLAELIRDLLRPDDEVLALWPPSEEPGWDGVQLLMADEDEVPEGSPLGQLIRRWSTELPTILLEILVVNAPFFLSDSRIRCATS